MPSRLSFDAILAALAVLTTTTACSKSEPAKRDPGSPASESAPQSGAPAVAPVVSAPPPAPVTEGSRTLDAGADQPAKSRKSQAACGAGSCSADMKK